jgi:hypothetical protein
MIDVEEFKMKEIVKIEDSGDELIVSFTENKTMKIKIVDGKLVSELV